MIRKNEELHEIILSTLKGENRKMSDIRQNMVQKTGNQYSYKQLQNTIYHMVRTGKVGRSEDGEYFLKKGFETGGEDTPKYEQNGQKSKERQNIFESYQSRMKEICLEEEKKLKNPFEKFIGEELLEAQKIYEMNKKILQILKDSPEK